MNKDFSQTPRPTFKRALRRISVISVVISMTLVWLLLSTASIFTLKQYAQKNLELTAATMGRSLEAALVFGDSAAAEETLASLGKQGQISQAIVLNGQMQHFAAWRHEPLANKEQVSGLISKWLFPEPTVQPIWHQGKQIGELRLTALDELISHFLGISILALTGSILLASFIALLLTLLLSPFFPQDISVMLPITPELTLSSFAILTALTVGSYLVSVGGVMVFSMVTDAAMRKKIRAQKRNDL